MDLTVDVQSVNVEPEYPAQVTYSTETYFINQHRVQLLQEVESKKISVEQFLQQVKEEKGLGQKQSERQSASAESGATASAEAGRGEQQARRPLSATRIYQSSVGAGTLPTGDNVYALYFDKDSADLKDSAYDVIAGLPENVCYRVAGFASPEGGEHYNLDLSRNRATSTYRQMEVVGYRVLSSGGLGEYSAEIWPGSWPEQRRVEIYSEPCKKQ